MRESESAVSKDMAICLSVAEWPALDHDLWTRAQQKAGLLDDPHPAAAWAPATQEAVAKAYGRWLSWLKAHDALDPVMRPAERTTLERIKAYVADLEVRNAPNTVHMRLLHLGRMLGVMAPGTKPLWFARVLRTLRAARRPVRDDRARLVPVADLLALGRRLIEDAEQLTRWSLRRRALHYRDGLLILFLCACPLRARSLAALTVGDHLQQRGDSWWVALSHSDTKTGSSLELPLPPTFTEVMARYLAHWRPILLERQTLDSAAAGRDHGVFWISESGKALRPKHFHEILTRVTMRELGRAINPHLFRKLVPSALAIQDPARVGIARPLLGHASYETTDRAYNLARAVDAARQVQETLGALRREARSEQERSCRDAADYGTTRTP